MDRLTALLRLHRSLDTRVDGTGEDVVRVGVAASLALTVGGVGGAEVLILSAIRRRKKHDLHGLSPTLGARLLGRVLFCHRVICDGGEMDWTSCGACGSEASSHHTMAPAMPPPAGRAVALKLRERPGIEDLWCVSHRDGAGRRFAGVWAVVEKLIDARRTRPQAAELARLDPPECRVPSRSPPARLIAATTSG